VARFQFSITGDAVEQHPELRRHIEGMKVPGQRTRNMRAIVKCCDTNTFHILEIDDEDDATSDS
jgi:hypothetical protein